MCSPLPPSIPPLVLVVDDDARAAAALAMMLGSDGFRVEVAHDSEAALLRLERGHFAALITDLEMPRKSGLELLRTGHPWLEGTLVVVVTAYASWQNAQKLAALGVSRQFTKPLDYEALLAMLLASLGPSATAPT